MCARPQSERQRLGRQHTRERNAASCFFLDLEGQSEKLHFIQDAITTMAPTTGAGASLLHGAGVGRSATSAGRLRKKDRGLRRRRTVEAIAANMQRPGTNIIFIWDDDYFRKWYLQQSAGLDDSRTHIWASIVIKTLNSPTSVVPVPTVDPQHGIMNPDGISPATIKTIIKWARPGFQSFRDWFEPRSGVAFSDYDASAGQHFLTTAEIVNKIQHLNYASTSNAEAMRRVEDSYVWNILPQNFKSYQEMLRCMLHELCNPDVYKATSNGRLVFSIGDHPKVLLQFNLRMQGDTVGGKGDPRRTWAHLGDLLKAATEACADGNAPEARWMWAEWGGACGMTGGGAVEEAGRCCVNLVPFGPGPLHAWINPMTDIWR